MSEKELNTEVKDLQITPSKEVQLDIEGLGFIKTESAIKTFSGFSFWMKIACILSSISVFIIVLYGLFSLLFIFANPAMIIIPLFFFGIAGFSIYLITKYWTAANTVANLQNSANQEEYNKNSLKSFDLIRSALKIDIITMLVVVGLGIVLTFLSIFIIFSQLNSNPEYYKNEFKKSSLNVIEKETGENFLDLSDI
jgi:hypothetical protein